MYIPCGQCIGCRLERSRQWAIRCVHEAKQHEKNCFITLTYDDKHLPKSNSLIPRHVQLFMKKLRKKYGAKIRFFSCGEYGEKGKRPHYHACLFNHDFDDKILWSVRDNIPLYVSESLNKIWGKGFTTIGDVTFESAAYVARYITKKITGDQAELHYQGRVKEFTNMSRRPGIGRQHYEKYKGEIYANDSVLIYRGKPLILRPPKYYDKVYENQHPTEMEKIKNERIKKHNDVEMQWYRLKAKEFIKKQQLKQLKRGLENE